MADIFMSHIHNESAAANELKKLFDVVFGNPDIFISSGPDSIGTGNDWLDAILNGLKTFKVQIILLSPESIKKEWVLLETGAAWYRKSSLSSEDEPIIVIPACYGGVEISSLQQPLSSLQATNLTDEHSVIKMLYSMYKILKPNKNQRPDEIMDVINRYKQETQLFVRDITTRSESFMLKKKLNKFKDILVKLQHFFDSSNKSANIGLRADPTYTEYGSIKNALIQSGYMELALDTDLIIIKGEIDNLCIPGLIIKLGTIRLDTHDERRPYQILSIELMDGSIVGLLAN